MPNQCVAHTCKNIGKHLFPQDESSRTKWVRALRLDVVRKPGWQLKKTAYICSDHFKPEDFMPIKLAGGEQIKRRLKANSVPSIFPWTIPQNHNQQTNYVPPVKGNVTITRNLKYGNTGVKQKSTTEKKYGYCRCCLKQDEHDAGNIKDLLDCLNVEIRTDRRLSQLICLDCCKFLQQASKFRDMVAASQRELLKSIPNCDDNKDDVKMLAVKVEYELNSFKELSKLESEIPPSVPLSDFTSDVKQENVTDEVENVPNDRRAVPMVTDHDDFPDDDRGLSDLSDDDDDDDFKIPEENNKTITNKELKLMERIEDAQLNLQIRENLSTILQYSTVMPFSVASKNDLYECIYCEESFIHFIDLKNHVDSTHDEGYEYKTQSLKMLNLKRDPEMILLVDISRIKCKLCGEQLPTIHYLVQHLILIHDKKYHHLSADPPHNVLCFDLSLESLKCLDCDKVFTHLKGLLMHMNQHYGSFLCAECGSKFLHERSYKMHMLQKAKGDLPRNECPLCKATYSRQQHLKRHMKQKHPNGHL